MKTLADFKRKAIVGSKWHTFFHPTNADKGERVVAEACTTYIAFHISSSYRLLTYLHFPKASECKFPSDNVVEIYEDDKHYLTYTLID